MTTFYALYRTVRRINSACLGAASLLIVLITALTVWEAITRYFLRLPATWTYPATSYMLLWSIYLGVAYALQRGAHVSVDFVVEMVPSRPRRWLLRLGHLLGLAFTLIFLQQSWRLFLRHAIEGQRDISTLSLPLVVVSWAVPAGLGLMAITYLFVLVDSFARPAWEPTIQEQELASSGSAIQLE
ncbi:MAG TPA: TRAP transporter small permease subunit [Chloroflexota bacterium]|nr:TRAP transporter small permease subunit [Chloroflexota bacterium]